MRIQFLAYTTFQIILFTNFCYAQAIHVGSFNINANNTKANHIAKQLAEHRDIELWGISESTHSWKNTFVKALKTNGDFKLIAGTSGVDKNNLQIFFDQNKYHLISHTEIDEIGKTPRARAPLIARFIHKYSNYEFLFMVNHLQRYDNKIRLLQAEEINKWIKKQKLPVIAVGDYNFDLSPFDISKHGPGLDAITKDNILTWLMPSNLLPTQCSSYKSILDFIFISDKVIINNYESAISYPDLEYCNNQKNSDHRPITAMIAISDE